MSKIYGNQETIKKAKDAQPGEKYSYINWDAIQELPDEYEVLINEVKYDPKNLAKDFTNVGTESDPSWYPKTSLMMAIAEARGISGASESIVEPIYEEIDLSIMNMDGNSKIVKRKVGIRVKKAGIVLEEDGSSRRSSVRSGVFNAWDECNALWSNEEMWTAGYTKQSKFPPKYDTKYKRINHFNKLLLKAEGQADTKAYLKTVRELAGLPTGFKTVDLQKGYFIFPKVRRSKEAIKMETAARLKAISNGTEQIETKQVTKELFGEKKALPPVEEETARDEMIRILEAYKKEGLTEKFDFYEPMIHWLKSTKDAEKNTETWQKALRNLAIIEKDMPEFVKIKHKKL